MELMNVALDLLMEDGFSSLLPQLAHAVVVFSAPFILIKVMLEGVPT